MPSIVVIKRLLPGYNLIEMGSWKGEFRYSYYLVIFFQVVASKLEPTCILAVANKDFTVSPGNGPLLELHVYALRNI